MPPRSSTAPSTGTKEKSLLGGWIANAKSKWGEASKQGKERAQYQQLPPATYLFRVDSVTIGPNKDESKVQIHAKYIVAAGDKLGKQHHNFVNLDGDDAEVRLARFMMQHGIDPETVQLTEKAITAAFNSLGEEKPYLKATLRFGRTTEGRDPYLNTWIDQFLGTDYDPGEFGLGDIDAADDDDDEDVEADSESDEDADADEDTESEDEESEDEEAEEAEDEDEEPDAEVGMEVEYPWKGGTATGVIKEILEDTEQLKVRTEVDGVGKIRTIDAAVARLPKK